MDYQAKTDWNYNDTVTEKDLNRIEAGLGDLHERLDNDKRQDIVLSPGVQTITVERDTPFKLSKLNGRLLLNLLGRAGTFASTTGWTFTGGSGSTTTTNILYGSTSLLLTLSAVSGRVNRSISTVAGSRYLAVVEVKLGTASSAYISVTGSSNSKPVSSNSDYVITYVPFTASAATTDVGVTVTGSSSQTAYIDGFRVYEISATDYNAVVGMTTTEVATRWPYTEGLAGVKNPYAIRWSDSKKTNLTALLGFDTELLSAPVPVTDTEIDTLQQGLDGQYYKSSGWYRYILSGNNTNFITSGNFTGYKWIRLKLPVAPVKDTGHMLKFDGSIISRVKQGAAPSVADQQVILDSGDATPDSLLITVSNVDSGWGDNYTPTDTEVKAYFYGWVMYDGTQSNASPNNNLYNGTGTKAWAYRTDGISRSYAGPTATLPTTQASFFSPYELMYKRSISVVEPVISEGALHLLEGENSIEIGSGLIIRENVKPQTGDGSAYYINARSTFVSGLLAYNSTKLLFIYRNGLLDVWGQDNGADSLGSRQAGLGSDRFDKTAAYTVTYFARSLFPATPFNGEYLSTERAIIDDLIQDLGQTVKRVSAIESKKAEKDAGINWIYPTLINNWTTGVDSTRTQVRYAKIGGFVLVQGEIRNGTLGTAAFKLPVGYRPSRLLITIQRGYSGSAVVACSVTIAQDGSVAVIDGTNNEISIAGILFVPET